jgi:FkbM family methyltransferase
MQRPKALELLRHGSAAILRRVPFPGRERTFRLIDRILGPNPGEFVVPLRGGGRLAVDGIRDSYTFYLGDFQWNVHHFLCSAARSGQTVFDIGSNIGFYTVPLALRVGPRGHVYAFEACRPNYERLVKNITLNALKNTTPVFGAVTDRTGTLDAPLLQHGGNYSLASTSETRTQIPSWCLDDFVAGEGIDHIDLMKIDIEGSEVLALRGARKLLSEGRVRTAICEFNPYWLRKMGSSAVELYEIFESYRMEAFVLTRFARLKPIGKDFCRTSTEDFDAVLKRKTPVS